MTIRTIAIALTLSATAAAGVALAAAPATAANPSSIGPAVGSRVAMNARLIDSAGKPTTIAAISAGKPVMVVMFRSAKWCPFCQAQLKGLGPVAAAAKAKGVRFIAVSYDAPATLAAFGSSQNLSYPLYSDSGSKLIDAMKLRDPQYAADSFAYGVPYPTTMLIGANGVVKGKIVETDYKVRPTEADLIAMLAKA